LYALSLACQSLRQRRRIVGSSYRDLRVWQLAMERVVQVYARTRAFPREEIYGLTSQMRRSAVSVPSNIAEGKGRSTDRDRAVFFCHERGSLLELETQILIAQHLEYVAQPDAANLLKNSAQLGRMLNSLIQSLKIQPTQSLQPENAASRGRPRSEV
jgi:four helix bundle protein